MKHTKNKNTIKKGIKIDEFFDLKLKMANEYLKSCIPFNKELTLK